MNAKLNIHLNSRIGGWDICSGKTLLKKLYKNLVFLNCIKCYEERVIQKTPSLIGHRFLHESVIWGYQFYYPQGKDLAYRTLSSLVLITCNIEFVLVLSIGVDICLALSPIPQLSGLLFHLQRKKIFLID